MTPKELFDKVEQELGHTSQAIRFIANTTSDIELHRPIPFFALPEFYEACYCSLQHFGICLINGEKNYDDMVWRRITKILKLIQKNLNEEFKTDLPEREIISIVDEMIAAGHLKIVQDDDGQECVALEENPYDIKIRIIRTPLGQAPEEVRNNWIGIELPARFIPGTVPVRGLVTNLLEFKKSGVFQVPYQVAIEQLQRKAPAAAQWFIKNLGEFYPPLIFDSQCAETIQTH